MWNEIAAWQIQLHLRPDLSAKTIALYTQDARSLATWLQQFRGVDNIRPDFPSKIAPMAS